MRELLTEEIKRIQIEILDEIDRFCSENGLIYSLCGGTMLGAVRHRGFIPWDDDIDLMMPRTDYDRFKATFVSDRDELIDLSEIESCEEQFLKVFRKGTWMEDVSLRRRLYGVFVDVFPIDGLPEDYQSYVGSLLDVHDTVVKACPIYKTARRNRLRWYLRYLAKMTLRGLKNKTLENKRLLNEMAREHLPENSPLSTVIFGDFRVFPFPTSMFQDIKDIEFEGNSYKCISDTDQYLRVVYGDYMTPPPEEKRVSHHLYDSFIEE